MEDINYITTRDRVLPDWVVNLEGEEWKRLELEGSKSYFLISNYGRIFSLLSYRMMKPGTDKRGYLSVRFRHMDRQRTCKVHRLVAEVYIQNLENKPCINHKDGNKTNNHVSNLEWVTPHENNVHQYRTGLNSNKGLASRASKLEPEHVIAIRLLKKQNNSLSANDIVKILNLPVTDDAVGRVLNKSRYADINFKIIDTSDRGNVGLLTKFKNKYE